MKAFNIITFMIAANLIFSISPYAQSEAVDLEVALGEAAVYTLLDDGTIRTAGQAVNLGRPVMLNAVDLTLSPSLNGYYVLDADGTLANIGDAVGYGSPDENSGPYIDFELSFMQNGYYILSEEGRVFTFADAVSYGDLERDELAVDFELSSSGFGYYILYEDGVIEIFGDAVNYGFEQSTSNRAVDLEVTNQGYYVAYDDGTLRTFGGAVPLPSNQTIDEGVVDITLTSRGFRSLTADGEIRSYMNLESSGQIGWFAQMKPIGPSQATPTPVQTPTPTPEPDDAFFANLPSGFTERVIASIPEVKILPDVLINGQVSLPNGNTYIITTDEADEVVGKEIRLYEAQLFSDESYAGEVFLSIASNRTAYMRGLSFSNAGMIVTVTENTVNYLVLIEGDFESTEVNGFLNY